MKKCVIILLVSIFVVNAYSQKEPDRKFINVYYDASSYMYENNFNAAIPLLEDLNKVDPENANIQYKLGVCYLQTRTEQKKAAAKLEFAVENIDENYNEEDHREKNAPPVSYFYLGEAYRINHNFDKSINAFKKFKSYLNENEKEDKINYNEAERQIEITKRAAYMVKNPTGTKIEIIQEPVNSVFSDHTPLIDINGSMLIFTSKRPKANEEAYNKDEDIFISEKVKGSWSEPIRLPENINTNENEACVSVSADGDNMLFFRSKHNAGNIFTTERTKGLKIWSNPQLLTKKINSDARETHASIAPDNNSIYFTSDRESGFGGRDIYVVRRLPNNKYSKPRLLGQNINTKYDEETPFMHPDGKTLFFSSNGHNTMGGYDIYYAKMKDDYTFTKPKNLGYPVNNPADNVSYVLRMDGRIGYMTGYEQKGVGDLDLIKIIHKSNVISRINVFKGDIKDMENNIPDNVEIVAENTNNEEIAGVYKPDNQTGKYFIALPPGNEFELKYFVDGRKKANAFINTTYDKADDYFENGEPEKIETVIVPVYDYHGNIVFAKDDTVLTDESYVSLDRISTLSDSLQGENYTIDVKYSEDKPLADERYNIVENNLNQRNISDSNISINGNYKDNPEYVLVLDIMESDEYASVMDLADNQTKEDTAGQEPVEEKVKSRKVYVKNILFDFDSYKIKSRYYSNLNKLSDYMSTNTDAVVQLEGYTDSKGSNEYNYLLSYKRAKSVKDYLVDKGVSSSNLITKKYGEKDPVAANKINGKDFPEGRRFNRRVEFSVKKQGERERLIIEEIKPDIKDYKKDKVLADDGDYKYTIQIFALKNRRSIDYFDDLIGVKEYVGDDGFYRYTVGKFKDKEQAIKSMRKLEDKGYNPFLRHISYFKE